MLRDIVRTIEKAVSRVDQETIPGIASLGRTAARTVRAGRNLPAFDVSALDGFACKGKGRSFVVIGSVEPGERSSRALKAGEALFVPTGAAIPAHTLFVPREHVAEEAAQVVIRKAIDVHKIWPKGYWIRKGDHVVKRGEIIGPRTMELLSLAGQERVTVYRRPGVRLLSSGNELKKGIIPASNQHLLAGLLQRDGADVLGASVTGDDEREIGNAISHARDADLLLVTGGTAKGMKDMTRASFQGLGATFVLQFLPIVPGKTMTFGIVKDVPFFILPGNPRALRTLYEVFVRPCLAKLSGKGSTMAFSRARAPETVDKEADTIQLIPVVLSGGHPVHIEPLHAGEPDGFVLLERGTKHIEAGEEVSVLWVHA